MWRFAIAVLLSAGLAGAAYTYSQRGDEPTFITAPVEKGVISTVVKAAGTIDPIDIVDVSSQLSGRIAEVLVDFNDNVKAGQVLARLDPDLYAARVSEARAALSVAKANIEFQKAALERSKAAVENARIARKMDEAQLAAAQVRQQEVERDFQRKLSLSRSSTISDRELSQAAAARDAGAAGLRALQEQINMKAEAIEIAEAELSMAQANLTNANAVVEQRQAALDQANADRDRTEIRAPLDGVIIKRDVNAGQTVTVALEAKTLFQIAHDLREMQLRGRIDEADIGRLRIGQTARFTVDAYPDRTFTGRVLQIRKAPESTQNVVTYTVIISAPNPDLLLFPGMTAVLRVIVSETDDTLKIPNQALRFRPRDGKPPAREIPGSSASTPAGTGTVWTLDPSGSLVRVAVKLGMSDENSTQLLEGPLREGQPLVVGTASRRTASGPVGLRF